jgi:hypothetical protein
MPRKKRSMKLGFKRSNLPTQRRLRDARRGRRSAETLQLGDVYEIAKRPNVHTNTTSYAECL